MAYRQRGADARRSAIGSFSASSVTFTKMMGIGMVVALSVDATIVRLLLVPATMKLAR